MTKHCSTWMHHALDNLQPVFFFFALSAFSLGCGSSKDSTEKSKEPSKRKTGARNTPESQRGRTAKTRFTRSGHYPVRSLVREAIRAELWQDGLFINLGTRDQQKFPAGISSRGWRSTQKTGDVSYAQVAIRSSLTITPAWKQIQAVHLRGRSAIKGQVVSLFVDGKKVGGRKLSKTWQTHTFALKKPLSAARHEIGFRLLRRGKKTPPAQFAWAWFCTQKKLSDNVKTPAGKVANYDFGKPRRGLRAEGGRRYSFYLEVPKNSFLVFDYGAEKPTLFEISATVDGWDKAKTIFKKTSSKNTWQKAKVDLSKFGGKLIRLDFISKGRGALAGWGEPEIMQAGRPPRVPPVTPVNRAQNLIFIGFARALLRR